MKITDTIEMVLEQKTSGKILSIAPEQTVYDALELMAQSDVGALFVLSQERLVGVFTERDYARKVILKGQASRETKIGEIMTNALYTVTPQHTVDECMNMMTEHRIRHLPVLEGEKLVGVVSIGDLVKWVISGQAHAIEVLEGYIKGCYPC